LHDIETLINHFFIGKLGTVIPEGEAHCAVEAAKGINGYYCTSDGGRVVVPDPGSGHHRLRICKWRQLISRGATISDLIAILGALDFVLADVDR